MVSKNLLSVILILFIFFLSFFFYFNLRGELFILEKKEIYTQIIISDSYGIDINGSALMFGMMPPGNSASRVINLRNYYGEDVKLKIYIKGNISKFLSVSENNFLLKGEESKNISFVVSPTGEVRERIYSGVVKLMFSKA